MVALVARWLAGRQRGRDHRRDPRRGRRGGGSSLPTRLRLLPFARHPNGHHIWVPVPRAWTMIEFVGHLQKQGSPSSALKPSAPRTAPHAIRVSLGAASSQAELVRALGILAAALKSSAGPDSAWFETSAPLIGIISAYGDLSMFPKSA